jgi:hypothetical protein
MAFPSSLILIPLGGLIESSLSQGGYIGQISGNSLASAVTFFVVVLVIGYIQWFVIVPSLARTGWRIVDTVAKKSTQTGKWLKTALGVARVILRWGGAAYFLVLALDNFRTVPLAVLFLSGAIVVFLAFRRRRHPPQLVNG